MKSKNNNSKRQYKSRMNKKTCCIYFLKYSQTTGINCDIIKTT